MTLVAQQKVYDEQFKSNTVHTHTILKGAPDLVVAAYDAPLDVRMQAYKVCSGRNDEVELLASINDAGNYNKSLRWGPGIFYLGALLDIPVLQNYVIDARGTTFIVAGDHAGIRFDSILDSWVYLHVVGSGNTTNGITDTFIEFKPVNNAPIDAQVGVWSNRILLSGIYNKSGAYNVGSTGLLFTPGAGQIHHNIIEVNDVAACEYNVHIASSGANAYRSNKMSIGISATSGIHLKVGSSGATGIKGNTYHVGRAAAGATAGVEIFGDNDIYELLEIAGCPADSGILIQSGATGNVINGTALIDTAGWTDSSGVTTNVVNTPGTMARNIEHHTTSDTLTKYESGSIHTNLGAGGAITLTLPQDARAGCTFKFGVMANQELRVDPGAAGGIYINGGKQGDDSYISANGIPESVELIADGNGDWIALSAVGTWTVV